MVSLFACVGTLRAAGDLVLGGLEIDDALLEALVLRVELVEGGEACLVVRAQLLVMLVHRL